MPRFTGYANSHQVLKPCFYKDILETKEKVEHGILELFHDAYVYARIRVVTCPWKEHCLLAHR